MIGYSVKWEKSFETALSAILLIVAVISVAHIFSITESFSFSTTLIGGLGWILLGMALLTFSRGSRRQTVLVFLVFFCFGLWRGPYLEPPADPFEHLRRINTYSDSAISAIPSTNRGFWHYSMATVVINAGADHSRPAVKLFRLHLCHALFLGSIFSVIFLVSLRSGLTCRWSFFSCLVAFLFMGPQAISFFSYYSLAPTFTSLMIYWMWIGSFFLTTAPPVIARGVVAFLVLLPILIVNHLQEAAFLTLAVVVWLLMAGIAYFYKQPSLTVRNKHNLLRYLFLGSVMGVLFLAPQLHLFRSAADNAFFHNRWQENQNLLVYFGEVFLFCKIWAYRIENTYLPISIVIGLLSPLYFLSGVVKEEFLLKLRIWVLSLLPLVGFCIPLFCFVWVSNVRYAEFYRLSYTSMFWLFFALFAQGLEKSNVVERVSEWRE